MARGGSGGNDSQMWRDKRKRDGFRWKLSTNLKERVGKVATARVVRVVTGGERDGG